MSKLDKIIDRIQPEYVEDIPRAKELIKELFLETIEEAYIERTKQENRKGTYETGTRLLKRILKKKVKEL